MFHWWFHCRHIFIRILPHVLPQVLSQLIYQVLIQVRIPVLSTLLQHGIRQLQLRFFSSFSPRFSQEKASSQAYVIFLIISYDPSFYVGFLFWFWLYSKWLVYALFQVLSTHPLQVQIHLSFRCQYKLLFFLSLRFIYKASSSFGTDQVLDQVLIRY